VDSIVVGLPEGVQLPQATGVYATYEPESKHPAIHAIDQSMDTWWTSDVAGNYVEVDFGEVLDLTGVAVAFNFGEQRHYLFDILVSEDQMNYTRIYSGQSTGLTNEYEYIAVPIEARYIRLVGSGHLDGKWTAVKELQAVVASGEGAGGSGEGSGDSGEGSGSDDSGDDVIVPSGPKVYIDVNSDSEQAIKDTVGFPASKSVKGSWEAMTEGGKTYPHLVTASDSEKGVTPSVELTTNAENLKQYVLQVDIWISGETLARKISIGRLYDGTAWPGSLLTIEKNGTLSISDVALEGTVEFNQWVTLAIAVDCEAGTCSVYKNGVLVGENCSLADGLNVNPVKFRLQFGQGKNNADNTANVWFDNIKLYEGLELLDKAAE